VVECLSSKRETNWFKPQYCKKKKKKKKKVGATERERRRRQMCWRQSPSVANDLDVEVRERIGDDF
jgi:hypothetical protein